MRRVGWASWRLLWMAMGLSLAACTSAPVHNPMARWVESPNYDIRRPVIIVLHFTDQHSVQESLDTLRSSNSQGQVSAHYLIGANGDIFQLVDDDKRAWHAGSGRWGTITDLNSASIGIELDNDGHAPFAKAQIDSLLRLLGDLTTRLRIPRSQVIGHEDLAPGRKNDPGPLFPWRTLAQAGYGLWPKEPLLEPPPGFDPWLALSQIGYALDDRAAAVQSFRHHFRGMEGQELDADDLRVLYTLSMQWMRVADNP
ncbi:MULTISPECIES: N-acetylmuramoyl-L-alanine amidase [Dyella]|uniref:N-acetylmuramoyl-L-alanine amidase n=2 Tax=Dyella TaxID=231454 RepID=A0A4R0YWM3_9GAMM|nr:MULTISPECIES: N-acetylmuramoyl-L-alanine amidase [Dyella]TBR40657.1 N-acetylmuramoyl-L-alanine amidase [Dyella terrae]TCI13873.1 N-acetylmuramoyl-L-alanine amidase [Dyella soli]